MHVFLPALMILFCLCAMYVFMIAPSRERIDASGLKGWFYAHRGLHDKSSNIPENSMEAFRRAIKGGYGIELDVQLTSDGKLVVFHDKNLRRMCGVDKNLYELTYDELLRYTLPDGTAIPLFSETLKLVKGRVPLIVEVKYHHRVKQIAKATLEALVAYKGAFCIESFHPSAVRYFKTHAPRIIRGELADGNKWKPGDINIALHFCMKQLLPLFISRPHFVAYSVPTDHTLAMWLMKRVFKPLLVAWTIKDPQTLAEVSRVYDICIFELPNGALPEGEAFTKKE